MFREVGSNFQTGKKEATANPANELLPASRFHRLLHQLGREDVIIVRKLDRLSRSLQDLLTIFRTEQ